MRTTPYDTGIRLEPMPWSETHADAYGRVDFTDDEGGTPFTIYAEPDASGDGFVIRVDIHRDAPIRVEVTGETEAVTLTEPEPRP